MNSCLNQTRIIKEFVFYNNKIASHFLVILEVTKATHCYCKFNEKFQRD